MECLTHVVRPDIDYQELLNKQELKRYQSTIGSLLLIIKHTIPYLSNSVRELTKSMDRDDHGNYKKILCVLNYLNSTKKYGIKLSKITNQKWSLKFYSESDYAGYTQNRKSVSGWAIFIDQNLISWNSKQHKIVTTSSTEEEYMAVS